MEREINTSAVQAPRKDLFLASPRDFYADALKECEIEGDETSAAAIVRRRRNELLARTDEHMVLDRIGLTTPSYTLTGLIEFIKTMVKALSGDWAKYRQDLRDLPEQPGFPFNVVWPEEPKED